MFGKYLILLGLLLTALGLVMTLLPFTRLGKLPGDIVLTVKNGRVYIPLTTCLLLSVFLSLVSWLISYLRR